LRIIYRGVSLVFGRTFGSLLFPMYNYIYSILINDIVNMDMGFRALGRDAGTGGVNGDYQGHFERDEGADVS